MSEIALLAHGDPAEVGVGADWRAAKMGLAAGAARYRREGGAGRLHQGVGFAGVRHERRHVSG